MSGLHPTMVSAAHGYTREDDVPWEMDSTTTTHRLAHYLAGGGLRTFGRTIAQQRAARKHFRFWVVSAVLGGCWLLFYFV